MGEASYRLGIDFGTSTTVAMLQWPDGRVRPLLFDGSPLLSSAVLLGPDGYLYTGRDAAHLARGYPERLEPNPKRRIDEGRILLGDREVEVSDLVATVLRRVADEARTVAGTLREVILTCPVEWATTRRALLSEAAERAGLGRPRLAPEPVTAATYFARLGDRQLPAGALVLVYDLGAGTCDVTLLRHGHQPFEIVGSAGLDDVGGLDVDAAIIDHLTSTHGPLWTDAASRRLVWEEVRTGKEMLSRSAGTIVALPALGAEIPLNRAELDALARPVLEPTVKVVETLLTRANIAAGEVAGLFLVGGSSRIPLVGTMLHQTLGIAPTVTEQPQLVVAEGALHLDPTGPPAQVVPPVPPRPPAVSVGAGPLVPPPAPMPAMTGGAGKVLAVVAAVALFAVLAVSGAVALAKYSGGGRSAGGSRGLPSSSRGVPTQLPTGSAPEPGTVVAAKYAFTKVGNLCNSIDLGPLLKIFKAGEHTPDSGRYPSVGGSGSANCIQSLGDDRSGATAIVTVSFSVWVYESAAMAAQYQKSSRDNATANGNNPIDERGVGEEAFSRRKAGTGSGSTKDIEYALEIRDANLRLIGEIRAGRIDEGAWSQKRQTDIKDALVQSAKNSYTKVVAAQV